MTFWRRLVCFVGLAAMVGCNHDRQNIYAPLPCEHATVYQAVAGNWVVKCESGDMYLGDQVVLRGYWRLDQRGAR